MNNVLPCVFWYPYPNAIAMFVVMWNSAGVLKYEKTLKKNKLILILGAVTVLRSFQGYVPSFGSGPAFHLQDGQFPTSTDDLQLVLATSCSPLSAVALSKRDLCRCLRRRRRTSFQGISYKVY